MSGYLKTTTAGRTLLRHNLGQVVNTPVPLLSSNIDQENMNSV